MGSQLLLATAQQQEEKEGCTCEGEHEAHREALPKVRRAHAQRPEPLLHPTAGWELGQDDVRLEVSGGCHSPYLSVIWESWMGASSSTWLQLWARPSSLRERRRVRG